MKKSLSLFLALSLAAAVTAQAQKKSEKEVTVKGEVADIAQTDRGPYARIAILRPHDGRTVDFEAGTSDTSSGTGKPGTLGSGMVGPSGPVNDSGCSSTRRLSTRPPAWTAR